MGSWQRVNGDENGEGRTHSESRSGSESMSAKQFTDFIQGSAKGFSSEIIPDILARIPFMTPTTLANTLYLADTPGLKAVWRNAILSHASRAFVSDLRSDELGWQVEDLVLVCRSTDYDAKVKQMVAGIIIRAPLELLLASSLEHVVELALWFKSSLSGDDRVDQKLRRVVRPRWHLLRPHELQRVQQLISSDAEWDLFNLLGSKVSHSSL